MTGRTFSYIICDNQSCKKQYTDTPPDGQSIYAQRKDAVKAGWYYKSKSQQDFCPECAETRRGGSGLSGGRVAGRVKPNA